jgi:hypothetical protein
MLMYREGVKNVARTNHPVTFDSVYGTNIGVLVAPANRIKTNVCPFLAASIYL